MQTGFIRNNNQVEILRTATEVLGDTVLVAPAVITEPLDDSKYGQVIEIVNTIDDLVSDEIESVIDKGSLLLQAVKIHRKINKEGKLFIIPLEDDIDAVKATSENTFSGTIVSENTVVSFMGQIGHKYTINAIEGETFSQIAAKVASAINANDYELFTAEYETPILTLTAKNGGTHMNHQCLDFSKFIIPGIEIDTTPFTGGAFDPNITSLLDQVKNMRVNFCVPHFGWEAVNTQLSEKRTREFTNDKLSGYFIADIVKPIADVASLSLPLPERFGAFVLSVKRDVDNVDGNYFDVSNLHSYLTAVNVYASTNLQTHPDAILTRPSSTKYQPNVGGPNQYMRTFNGTILPNVPLSPFYKRTILTGGEQKLVESKGLSFLNVDALSQNVITSQLFTGDLTYTNSAGRTLNQLLLRDFYVKIINDTIQEKFSDAQIGANNAEDDRLFSSTAFKSALMRKIRAMSDLYPALIINANLSTIEDQINKAVVAILSNGVIFYEITLPIGQHVEEFQGKTTIATYSQL
jgi:hypothetical protein